MFENLMRRRSAREFGRLLLAVFFCFFTAQASACSSADDLKETAAAAQRTQGGGAEGSAGNKEVDFNAALSQTGDVTNQPVSVRASRTISTTSAGDTFAAVSVQGSGAPEALRQAIDADYVVVALKSEIAALAQKDGEETPEEWAAKAERRDKLRGELAARMKELADRPQSPAPPIHIGSVVSVVVAPKALGREELQTTADQANAIGDAVKSAVEAAQSRPTKDN